VRAAAGFDADDAFGLERTGHRQQALVFLGVDVVGDDHQIPALAHRLAEHLDQGGLARTDRPADAHAQGRQFLGAAGNSVQLTHGVWWFELIRRTVGDASRVPMRHPEGWPQRTFASLCGW